MDSQEDERPAEPFLQKSQVLFSDTVFTMFVEFCNENLQLVSFTLFVYKLYCCKSIINFQIFEMVRLTIQMTETEHPLKEKKEQSTCRKIVDTLKQDWVLIFTVVGIVVGFIVGLAIRPANPSDDVLMWIGKNQIM